MHIILPPAKKPIAAFDISSTTTLLDIREMINARVTPTPIYRFMYRGARSGRRQEQRRTVMNAGRVGSTTLVLDVGRTLRGRKGRRKASKKALKLLRKKGTEISTQTLKEEEIDQDVLETDLDEGDQAVQAVRQDEDAENVLYIRQSFSVHVKQGNERIMASNPLLKTSPCPHWKIELDDILDIAGQKYVITSMEPNRILVLDRPYDAKSGFYIPIFKHVKQTPSFIPMEWELSFKKTNKQALLYTPAWKNATRKQVLKTTIFSAAGRHVRGSYVFPSITPEQIEDAYRSFSSTALSRQLFQYVCVIIAPESSLVDSSKFNKFCKSLGLMAAGDPSSPTTLDRNIVDLIYATAKNQTSKKLGVVEFHAAMSGLADAVEETNLYTFITRTCRWPPAVKTFVWQAASLTASSRYATKYCSAVALQSWFRRNKTRGDYRKLRKGATLLQAHTRGFFTRSGKLFTGAANRNRELVRWQSATMVQMAFRRYKINARINLLLLVR